MPLFIWDPNEFPVVGNGCRADGSGFPVGGNGCWAEGGGFPPGGNGSPTAVGGFPPAGNGVLVVGEGFTAAGGPKLIKFDYDLDQFQIALNYLHIQFEYSGTPCPTELQQNLHKATGPGLSENRGRWLTSD